MRMRRSIIGPVEPHGRDPGCSSDERDDRAYERKNANLDPTTPRGVMGIVTAAISEWQDRAGSAQEIREFTFRFLDGVRENIILSTLGFKKDSWGKSTLEIDNSNGRTSAIASFITQSAQDNVAEWVDKNFSGELLPPSKAMTAAVKKEYTNRIKEQLRDKTYELARDGVEKITNKLFENIEDDFGSALEDVVSTHHRVPCNELLAESHEFRQKAMLKSCAVSATVARDGEEFYGTDLEEPQEMWFLATVVERLADRSLTIITDGDEWYPANVTDARNFEAGRRAKVRVIDELDLHTELLFCYMGLPDKNIIGQAIADFISGAKAGTGD